MKLTHVIPAFYPATAYGGPPNTTFVLSDELGRLGHEMLVLTTNGNGSSTLPGETDTAVRVGEHTTAIYSSRLCGDSVSAGLFAQLIRHAGSSDAVMLSGVYSFPTMPTLCAARIWSRRLLWFPHGAFTEWEGGRRGLLKRLWRAACRVVMPRDVCFVVSSDEEKDGVLRRFPGAEVAVVPFGIPIQGEEECRQPRRHGKVKMLFLGRLHPIKGLEQAIDALHLLTRSGKNDWSLTIAGSGTPEYEARLTSLVADTGLSEAIRFVGHVDGPAKRQVLSGHDVLLFPSHKESFGLSVLEALSYGMVVVAGSGTPWKALAEDKIGLWVDNTPASLAVAVEEACVIARTTDGEAIRRWASERFSITTCAQAVGRCLLRRRANRG